MIGFHPIGAAPIAAPPIAVVADTPTGGYFTSFDWAEAKQIRRRKQEEAERLKREAEAPPVVAVEAEPEPEPAPSKPPKALAELAKPRKAQRQQPVAQPVTQPAQEAQPIAPAIEVQLIEAIEAPAPYAQAWLDEDALIASATFFLQSNRKH
jgi:hypothetical protein